MDGSVRRRTFLAGLSALGLLPSTLARAATKQHLVLYWAKGGWDPSFVFDPHFESSSLDRDPASQSASVGDLHFAESEDRPAVTRFFQVHSGRCAIINGLAVGSISHAQCTRLVLTGRRDERAPDFATALGDLSGAELAMPTVVVSGPRFPGDRGGAQVSLTSTLTGTLSGELPEGGTWSSNEEEALRSFLIAESKGMSGPLSAEFARTLQRRDQLLSGADEIAIGEPTTWLESLRAGLSTLSLGLSRVLVVQGTLPLLSTWDTHVQNEQQGPNFEHAFSELASLDDLLGALPGPEGGTLADTTMVLAMSEMGRTPIKNRNNGKDHWPFSSLLAYGAGILGARVHGVTDDTLSGQSIDFDTGEASSTGQLLTPASLAAGLLEAFDVDPELVHPGVAPFRSPFS